MRLLQSPPGRVVPILFLGLAACSASATGGDAGAGDAGSDVATFDAETVDAPLDSAKDVGASDSEADAGQSYTTNFPLAENPISENGHWLDGKKDGADWADVRTTPALAHGTVVSSGPPYDDSTAVLTGTWGATQHACATVHSVNQTSAVYEEVEIRLRTTIIAHSITGYEFNFRATADGSQYVQIVRWNGALNSFDYVDSKTGPGIHDGDVVCGDANGSTLTASINGTQIVQGTDATFGSGNPGIGFYMQGGSLAQTSDYGFSSFTATAQ